MWLAPEIVRILPAAPGSMRAIASPALSGKTGSLSLQQTSAGTSHARSASMTRSIAAALGSSWVSGTRSGNAATPAFASGPGQGASYARRVSSSSSLVVADWMMRPTGRSRPTRSAKFRHCMKPGVGQPLEANRPVLSTTRRAKRSCASAATRRPMGPPQSCTTTVMRRRSMRSTSARIEAT